MTEIATIDWFGRWGTSVFSENTSYICSVVLLPAPKTACSSAVSSSACGWSLFRMIFNMTLLGWLIRLMVL